MLQQLELGLENLPGVYRFDGQENFKKWKSYGLPEGVIPDQYIAICRGAAVNLHILQIGNYKECSGCNFSVECRETALIAGEQMF